MHKGSYFDAAHTLQEPSTLLGEHAVEASTIDLQPTIDALSLLHVQLIDPTDRQRISGTWSIRAQSAWRSEGWPLRQRRVHVYCMGTV